jgi:poly(A) polymerase
MPRSELESRPSKRPLLWNDLIYQLQELFEDDPTSVYVVGGAVRDAYLHRPLYDLDLATPENAVQLARKIANQMNGDIFVLDAERDVGRVILTLPPSESTDKVPGRFLIDVAAFRGETLERDLRDRDFTLNAMAVDLKSDLNALLDPLDGEMDLIQKRIRQCDSNSLRDDPIRMLRAVRQAVQFGFSIEPETLTAIRAHAAKLTQTSMERVRDEFFKLLKLPKVTQALRIAARLGLLQSFIPEVDSLIGFKPDDLPFTNRWDYTLAVIDRLQNLIQAIGIQRADNTAARFELGMAVMQFDRYRLPLNRHLNWQWTDDRSTASLLFLAVLLRSVNAVATDDTKKTNPRKKVEVYGDALRLSNPEKRRLVICAEPVPTTLLERHPGRLATHRFWYQFGENGIDLLLIMLAEISGAQAHFLEQDAWLKVIDSANTLFDAWFHHYDEIVSPPPLLDGTELTQTLKLKPGPVIGQLLKLIREGQVTGAIRTVEDALEQARDYLNERGRG